MFFQLCLNVRLWCLTPFLTAKNAKEHQKGPGQPPYRFFPFDKAQGNSPHRYGGGYTRRDLPARRKKM
jgi:hypothetical protein